MSKTTKSEPMSLYSAAKTLDINPTLVYRLHYAGRLAAKQGIGQRGTSVLTTTLEDLSVAHNKFLVERLTKDTVRFAAAPPAKKKKTAKVAKKAAKKATKAEA